MEVTQNAGNETIWTQPAFHRAAADLMARNLGVMLEAFGGNAEHSSAQIAHIAHPVRAYQADGFQPGLIQLGRRLSHLVLVHVARNFASVMGSASGLCNNLLSPVA